MTINAFGNGSVCPVIPVSPKGELLPKRWIIGAVVRQPTPCSTHRERRPKAISTTPELAGRRVDRIWGWWHERLVRSFSDWT